MTKGSNIIFSQEVIDIHPEHSGETILQVFDHEGNTETVKILVGSANNTGNNTGGEGGDNGGEGEESTEQDLETELRQLFEELGVEYDDLNSQSIDGINIKDRHLEGGIEYKPGITSYFLNEEGLKNLILNIPKSSINEAKFGRYSITHTFANDVGFDRVIQANTNTLTVILDKNGNIITAHPGLLTN